MCSECTLAFIPLKPVPAPLARGTAPLRARRPRASPPQMAAARAAPGRELVRPPPSAVAPTGPLTAAEVDAFFRDGYIVARSLLPDALFARVRAAIPKLEAAQSIAPNVYDKVSFRAWQHDPVFCEVAAASPVAAAAAQLTPSSAGPRGLVVLTDAYFRMKGANIGCAFHVDDTFFWPAEQGEPGPGVNAWIALDDVTADGGGLAVAPGSHTEDFVDCRKAIEGGTCMIDQIAPDLGAKLEKISVRPTMKAGDVILHTRYMFHRGDPFRRGSAGESGPGIARYSVRYMPGEAVVKEKRFIDGNLIQEEPVPLRDADSYRFPAVVL